MFPAVAEGNVAEQPEAAWSAAPVSRLAPGTLVALAGCGWWWSARMAHQMGPAMGSSMGSMGRASMSFGAFVIAWVAMMAAMMFPAILPVVSTFRRAAVRGRAAPTPFFVAGYLLVWSSIAVPAYLAWRGLEGPVAHAAPWAGRLAGAAFLTAAAYQLSPLKSVCLRHCRAPISFFLRQRRNLRRPFGAAAAGATHGLLCLGCCWALMVILVALGTMQLAWMAALAALILVEKVFPIGELVARLAALAFLVLGFILVVHPDFLVRLT